MLTTCREHRGPAREIPRKFSGSRFAFPAGVPCRIEFRREDGRLIAHLAGRLTGAEVPALLEASDAPLAPILELDELLSADAVGLDVLMRLEQRGAQLRGMPEYLRLKMDVLERERKG